MYLEQMLWPFFRTAAFCYNQLARFKMTTEFPAAYDTGTIFNTANILCDLCLSN